MKCSFCDKGRQDVRHLLTGPNNGAFIVAICDECVDTATITLIQIKRGHTHGEQTPTSTEGVRGQAEIS